MNKFNLEYHLIFQVKLGDLEAELVEINANGEKLQRSYNELAEYKLVLQKVLLYVFSFLQFSSPSNYKKFFVSQSTCITSF